MAPIRSKTGAPLAARASARRRRRTPLPRRSRPLAPPQGPAGDRTSPAFPDGPLIGLSDNRPETLVDPRFKATRHQARAQDRGLRRGRDRRRAAGRGSTPGSPTRRRPASSRSSPSIAPTRARTCCRRVEEFRAPLPPLPQALPPGAAVLDLERGQLRRRPAHRPRPRPHRALLPRGPRGVRGGAAPCSPRTSAPTAARSRRAGCDEFKRGIGPGPHIWGLVSYPDVNRLTDVRTRARSWTRPTGDVWVVEVGAIHFFGQRRAPLDTAPDEGHALPGERVPAGVAAPEADVRLPLAASPTDRLFDSGLLAADGVPRPAYSVFTSAIRK